MSLTAARVLSWFLCLFIAAAVFTPALSATWQDPEAICSDTATTFCTGFEEGNFSKWTDGDGNPYPDNDRPSDPGPLNHAGNHVSRMQLVSGQTLVDLTKTNLPKTDRIYIRWYQLYEPGFFDGDTNSSGHDGTLVHAGGLATLFRSGIKPNGSDDFSASLETASDTAGNRRFAIYSYYPGMYQDCADPNGSCWGDRFPCFVGSSYCTNPAHRPTTMPPVPETNRWYCVEMMVDGGTPTPGPAGASGVMDFWIDGVELGPWTGLWMRNTSNLKIGELWIQIWTDASTHGLKASRQDNIVMSTQRIGCLDAQPPTGPTTPANLRRTDRRP